MAERLPLTPHGAARARFTGARTVDEIDELFSTLRAAIAVHDLPEEELFIAEELARQSSWLSPQQSRALCLAIIAVLLAARQGSTRLPLTGGPNGALGTLLKQLRDLAGLELAIGPVLAEIRGLAHANYFGRLIGSAGETRPLVAIGEALYLHRHYVCETELIGRLKARLSRSHDTERVAAAVDEAASSGSLPLSEEQRRAVATAMSAPLAIVSGGPGTGKTAIAAAILRAATALGTSPSQIALAAPTGKAAQRLSRSIARGLDGHELSGQIAHASTLHRLLAYRPGEGFRHGESYPLSARLVIVDEASMIDLTLMNQLLASLADDARLVLLGDADQLPSVEAGSVLRDLVVAGDRVQRGQGYSARLSHSYRMDEGDDAGRSILQVSRSIAAGDIELLAKTPAVQPEKLRFHGPARVADSPDAIDRFVATWTARILERPGFIERCTRSYSVDSGRLRGQDESEVADLLADLDTCKILTATRRDASGSEAIAALSHARVRRALGRSQHELGPGEPILVTRNDYRHGLFNGDNGVVVGVHSAHSGHQLRVAFLREDGIQLFPLQALRSAIELGHAVTVHRSQGSEYDHVALVVPPRRLPLLTRELIYTAVTRSRRSVTLLGPLPILRAAVRTTTQRYSGIVESLCADA